MKDFSYRRSQGSIDPEVIPPSSRSGDKAVSYLPKWAIYGGIGMTALLAIGLLRALFPLICLALIASFILNQSLKIKR